MQALGTAGGLEAQNRFARQVGVPSGLFGAAQFLREIPGQGSSTAPSATRGGFLSPIADVGGYGSAPYDPSIRVRYPSRFSGMLGGGT